MKYSCCEHVKSGKVRCFLKTLSDRKLSVFVTKTSNCVPLMVTDSNRMIVPSVDIRDGVCVSECVSSVCVDIYTRTDSTKHI